MGNFGLQEVSFSYGSSLVLSAVTLQLDQGVTVLLGKNGAGKTTLCEIATRARNADSGDLLAADRPVRTNADSKAFKARLGWAPQSLNTPGHLTVSQYLKYVAWLKGVSRRDYPSAEEFAVAATQLSQVLHRRIGTLSGGTKRRVVLAAAVVNNPAFLVLDEPTVGLDPEQRLHFHEIVNTLKTSRSILFSTHLMEDLSSTGDKVAVLDHGMIRFSGTVDELEQRALDLAADRHERLRMAFVSLLAPADFPS